MRNRVGRDKQSRPHRHFGTYDGLPIAHQVHPGNTAEAKTLLPMIRSLLARWSLKRVVLVADRGLLSLNNLSELAALQAELNAAASPGQAAVRLEYVLAVPAARYGEFKAELQALDAAQDATQQWVAEMAWHTTDKPTTKGDPEVPREHRLVVAHDPTAAQRRTQARRDQIAELIALGQQWGGRLDEQDAGQRQRGRPLSDSGAKARLYHAVKDASLAHLIKVDLHSEMFNFTIDEQRQQYLERLDGKLVLVTNSDAPAAEVVKRYKSLADIERGFRALKSEIEIGPVYHRLPKRIRAHALVCFLALILHRVLRMRLKASQREESPATLLAQLRRIHHQTVQTPDGLVLRGLTELGAPQKEMFTAVGLPMPTPAEVLAPAGGSPTARV